MERVYEHTGWTDWYNVLFYGNPNPPMESKSTSNCIQPPWRKCTFPPFLRSVLDFFLFCTATCTHSCLKSLYFLSLLNPLKNRWVWPAIVCKTVLFSHNRFWKVRSTDEDCVKLTAYFSLLSLVLIRFLASLQTFPLIVRAKKIGNPAPAHNQNFRFPLLFLARISSITTKNSQITHPAKPIVDPLC